MKTIAVLIVVLTGFGALSQDWRDTLKMARDAYKAEDYDKAIGFYEKAQKGAPENVDLSDEMAQSAYKSGDYEKAEKIYQQNQNNKQSATAKANNLHNLGNSRMKSKNYNGAVEAYKDALRANPNDEKTRYNLSEAMRKLHQEEKQNQQNSQDQQNGNQNNNSQQGQGNSGQKPSEQKQSQGSGQQQNSQQNQSQGGGQKKNGSGEQPQNNKGQLSDKTAERMLDELMRKEAETKKRIAGQGGGTGRSKSGKDW